MKFHKKKSRTIRKITVIILLLLFQQSGLFMGSEATAESTTGALKHTDSETDEKKADFLLGRPRLFIGLHTGMFFPRADSEVFDMITQELTLEKSDFNAWDFGFDLGFNLHERLALVLRYDYSDQSAGSEFRDFVDDQGLPITQNTAYFQSSFTAGIRYALMKPGRKLGEYIWLPSRFVPFIEGGVGTLFYNFKQEGDFVDSETLEIFPAALKSSSQTAIWYLGGGTDIYLLRNMYMTVDLRYSWASNKMGYSFVGFDDIDLSGLRITAGVSWHFSGR